MSGTVRSQNGYPIILSATSRRLRPWEIGGVVFTGRAGPEGFVLAHWLWTWNEELEVLQQRDQPGDDHWWGERMIAGTNIPSNHYSATATDANALRHPQGLAAEETFTVKQCRWVRTKMKDKYLDLLKWGGDFGLTGSGAKPDAMHTEVRDFALRAELRALAFDLLSTPVGKKLVAAQSEPVRPENW